MRLTALTLSILLGALLLQVESTAVKFGSCPVVNTFAPCEYPIPKKCTFDSHCPGKQKCCDTGCIIQCSDPWVPAQPSIKPGECPASPIPFIPCPPKIPKKDRHCNNDQDCKGKQKCCPYVCQYLCKDPTGVKKQ